MCVGVGVGVGVGEEGRREGGGKKISDSIYFKVNR